MRELAVAALIAWAAYRLWRLVAVDVITIRFRAWLFGIEVSDDYDAPESEDESTARFPRLFHMWHCPWCLGSWIAFGLTLAADLLVDGGIAMPVLVALGAAAGTGLLGANDPDQMYSGSGTG